MNSIGNILWFILGGILIAIIYYIVGLLMCITEASQIVANTYANIHYFRKDPDDIPPKPIES